MRTPRTVTSVLLVKALHGPRRDVGDKTCHPGDRSGWNGTKGGRDGTSSPNSSSTSLRLPGSNNSSTSYNPSPSSGKGANSRTSFLVFVESHGDPGTVGVPRG